MPDRRFPADRRVVSAAAALAAAVVIGLLVVAVRAGWGDSGGPSVVATAPPASTVTTVAAPSTAAPTPTPTTSTTAPPATSAPTTTVGRTTTTPPVTTAPSTTGPALPEAGTKLPAVPRPGEPVAAADAAGLAAQITDAEAAIFDPATPPAELTRQAHILQVAYRALVDAPGRRQATFDRLDAALRPVAEANVTAGSKLRSLIKTPRTALPEWRIVAPAPPQQLLGYYREAEASLGVPWYHLAAINLVETRMGRIRGDSEAGAQGPMQFLPATWAAYGAGGDIQSDRDSILAAARYLKRNGAPGDMRNALFNYNRDQRYVDAVLAYAEVMAASPRAYFGYHQWQVYYVTTAGDVWLPEGYGGG